MKWEKDLQAKKDEKEIFDLGEGVREVSGKEHSCRGMGHNSDEGFELSFDFFGLLKWLALRLSIIMNLNSMLSEDETQKIQLGEKCTHKRKDYLKQKQTKLVEECLLWHCSTLEDFDGASMNLAWLKFLNIEMFKRSVTIFKNKKQTYLQLLKI